ncbi:hypothetical protein PHLCEN_2v8553 [Hermanssonia centrifuga]|uniref:CRAL-TRIO domain-containing protein n=1 Tax=Hermanssonia centrifuga TaxID=98765 RepID=A0A2R6NU28_9APHY|nr:hypothetical protein PHLCEN_2v8553 [Hermanssonia centrifuga]
MSPGMVGKHSGNYHETSDSGGILSHTPAITTSNMSEPVESQVTPPVVPEAPSVAAVDPAGEPAQEEEPQNALTTKFTEEERTALKEFRASIFLSSLYRITKLPEIFKAAYSPDDAAAEPNSITLWGVTIDPKHPAQDARVSVILMKFLRARELKVSEAQTMLTATLRWRDEMKIDEILAEEFPDKIFGGVGRNFGHDKEGRPVTYNIYGGDNDVKAVFGDVQRFIRWRIALMENSIKLLDFETIDQMLQIHDYEGVSMTSRDANQKAAASEATSIFQNHYPEFLARKFFINVPTLLTWMFWFFKSILSAKTFAKMSVVGTGKNTISAALLPSIDAKQLPQRYGGEAEAF